MISVICPTARGKEAIKLVEQSLKRQTYKDFEFILQEKSPVLDGCCWSLNRDYNLAVKRSKGELIVSWQDYTFADATVLEKFWNHFVTEPKTLVTGVGNKYKDDSWLVMTWKDPKGNHLLPNYRYVTFNWIEANLCSIPRQALYDVGGFDETLDANFGMDFFSVVDRLNILGGYKFAIDQTIRSYSLEHGRPEKWDELNALGDIYDNKHLGYLDNPKLNFL